ncbi:MAG TPA: pyroglutamyl-peptidase I [Firmicutes bacterium]|nr:pyroglutamyl-peptidase I [Bacillota bacterium]
MKVLVTGFEPFGGETVNPAQQIVERLPQQVAGAQVVRRIVPCVFGRSIEAVRQAVEQERPDVVICIGQSGGRDAICPERVAINISDARIPDNAGNQPIDEPIFADGQNAYFSTLPIKAIAAAVRQAGIPCQVSNTAGTYVCNHLMYGLLYHIQRSFPGVRGGFIHVPFLPQQVEQKPGTPSLPLDDMVQAILIAIETCVNTRQDVHTAEGAEH